MIGEGRQPAGGRSRRRGGPRRRSAFTIMELLLAAVISALVATAGAAMIFATINASMGVRDMRDRKTSGQYALSRVAAAIRQARGIGRVHNDQINLWTFDRNGDDIVNLDETAIIHVDGAQKRLVYIEPVPPANGSLAPVSRTDFTSLTALNALITNVSHRNVVWAEDLEAAVFLGQPALTDTRLVEAKLTFGSDPEQEVFQITASPRGSADYLFIQEANLVPLTDSTRKRREYVSQWSGLATLVQSVEGTATTVD